MLDTTATQEIADDARARSNVLRLAAAQALTGANSAVIFATGSIVGATLAPTISLATVPLSMYVLGLAAGLIAPTEGVVESPASAGAMVPIVFQDYRTSLFPQLSALDNIALPSIIAGESWAVARERARALIDDAGMSFDFHRRPGQISGGQAQLVALLRALQLDSPLVLFDEPSSALDMFATLDLAAVTSRLLRARHSTALFVSHSLDEALLVSDEILILAGRPSRVAVRVEINLPAQRTAELLHTDAFASVRGHIGQLISESLECHDA